ncbi:hypothetical protein [Streptomyces sp. NPDC053069]|uniref:hypothetical protein n=1 Tax=Streptomyces sp. NPDC053069 TaxID=3365695 RepID=UPI0037D3CE8F
MNTRDNIDPGSNPDGIERVLRARAEAFRYSSEMEKAAEQATKGEQLAPSLRMALGYYSDAKKAAGAAGRDVSAPVAADNLSAAYNSLNKGA